jgi:hypothetical protein
MAYKRFGVTNEVFVRTWFTSENIHEVSQKLSMPVKNVHARATRLRGLGVPLKKLSPSPNPGRPPVDVAGLKKICRSFGKE